MSPLEKQILVAASGDRQAVFVVAHLPDGRDRIHAGSLILTSQAGQHPAATLEKLGLVRRIGAGRYQLTHLAIQEMRRVG